MLHKHAATIRPYPPPTRQHAAARPNSRQIRQMSAMPANPPFHSQLAARPNNRRHHQPTATHPQTTSTPNLSQTLMISRQTLDLVKQRSYEHSRVRVAPPIPKIPPNPKNHSSDNPPNANHSPSPSVRVSPPIPYPKNHSSDNGQTLARPLICSRRPSHPENPPKSQKSQFRQSAQRKSQPIPNIPKITVQTTVKHAPGHSSVRGAPPIPKIPPNPKNHSSDNPPNANHSPSPISHDLVQAVLLSTIHYPLVFTKNQKLKTRN